MTITPSVSVLTTCYNREALIGQAIESVLNSSFGDFEYIVVDDASTDRSAEIARYYAKTDSRIRIYINEQNLGDYPNRSRAASLARGKYFKYVDSDDIIYPHGLQVMMDCMRAFPDAALGLSRPADAMQPFPICLDPAAAYTRHFFGGGLFSNAPLSAIIRRDCFEKVGGFSGKRYVGDTELWLKLARHYSVVLMPMGLTWWRSHGEQEYALGHRTLSYVTQGFAMLRAALEDPDCPLPRDQAAAAVLAARTDHTRHILGLARRGSVRQALKIARASGIEFQDVCRAVAAKFSHIQN